MSSQPTGPRTRLGRIDANTKLIAALGRYGKSGSIVLAGKTWSIAALQKMFSDENALADATTKAYAAWRDLVGKLGTMTRDHHQVRKDLEQAIRVAYGEDASVLIEFGYAKRRPRRKLTQLEQVAAAARGAATRQARGTKGKRQRLKIKASL